MERRDFLKLGAVGATAGTAGLAGCSAVGLGGSGGGNVDAAAKWLPKPGAFSADLDHYSFSAYSPKRLAAVDDDVFWKTSVAPDPGFGNPNAKQFDWVVDGLSGFGSRGFTAYVGSFDTTWATTVLENEGYTRESTYEDYSLYTAESAPTGYAVGENAVLRTEAIPADDGDLSAVAKKVVDANTGAADRYGQGNEDMQELTDAMPSGHRFTARTFERRSETNAEAGQFENTVASGKCYQVEGSDTTVTTVLAFLNESDVVDRDLETYVADSTAFTHYRSRPTVETNGRVATITGTVPTSFSNLF